MAQSFRAIGLMSGTSMDGIDVALLESDGESVSMLGPSAEYPYSSEQRTAIRQVLGRSGDFLEVSEIVTRAHTDAVVQFCNQHILTASDVDLLGFHGQTTFHDPDNRVTVQLGDGALLAKLTGINVVNDFRSADVADGGQGAPFAPLYHAALARDLDGPIAVVNIGGVGNVTWISDEGDLLAFDTGPGNAMVDDWVSQNGAGGMDKGGDFAANGKVDQSWLEAALREPYFNLVPPKSLDRGSFSHLTVSEMNLENGAATLTALTAACIDQAARHFPEPAKAWYISGGGRHNRYLMTLLNNLVDAPVAPVEAVGWRGDSLEAEAFAFLAVRSRLGLPLSLPTTTGVISPLPGGSYHPAP